MSLRTSSLPAIARSTPQHACTTPGLLSAWASRHPRTASSPPASTSDWQYSLRTGSRLMVSSSSRDTEPSADHTCSAWVMRGTASCSVTMALTVSCALPKGTRTSSSNVRTRSVCAASATTTRSSACCSIVPSTCDTMPACTKACRLPSCLRHARQTAVSPAACTLGSPRPTGPRRAFMSPATRASPAGPASCSIEAISSTPLASPGGGHTRSGCPSSSAATTRRPTASISAVVKVLGAAAAAAASSAAPAGGSVSAASALVSAMPASGCSCDGSTASTADTPSCAPTSRCVSLSLDTSSPKASSLATMSPTSTSLSPPIINPAAGVAPLALSSLTSTSAGCASPSDSALPPSRSVLSMLLRSTPCDSNCVTASSTASSGSISKSSMFSLTASSNVSWVMRRAMTAVVVCCRFWLLV
eukprot:m.102665 g.102665  ORF g.102665 m.102665 type:complete len:417 (+) comp15521_c1_seq3:520-1770(+)